MNENTKLAQVNYKPPRGILIRRSVDQLGGWLTTSKEREFNY